MHKDVPSTGKLQQTVILDVRHLLVSAAFTRETLQPRCRVFEGFDPTEMDNSETSHDIRSIQLKCVTCGERKTETSTPITADLPEKLSFGSHPLTNTGIDYFGPLHVW